MNEPSTSPNGGARDEQPAGEHAVAVAIAAVRAGGQLTFGEIWVSASGVGKGDKTIPWERVGHLSVGHSGLVITDRGTPPRSLITPVQQVPNHELLVEVVQRLRDRARPRRARNRTSSAPNAPRASSQPRTPTNAIQEARSTNRLIFGLAVVAFLITALVDWPVQKVELCDKLGTLQSATGAISQEIDDLQDAAEDYRGTDQAAIRSDAERIAEDLEGGKGPTWVNRDDINDATGSIRTLCGDD